MENFKFTPKQWVLVRDGNGEEWCLAQFSNYSPTSSFGYTLCGGASFKCCIPFEGNEHLLGKMDDYVEPYVPKDGDFVTYTYNDGKYVAILSCKESDSVDCFYVSLCLGNKIEDLVDITTYNNRFQRYYIERRPSTEEEKQWLLDALHKDGKDWNAKKMCIEDVYQPKDGDFVTFVAYVSQIRFTAICKRYLSFTLYYHAGTVGRERDKIHLDNAYSLDCRDVVKPATDSEKQQLLDALHKEGKDWDAEKKEIVECKWKPKGGDRYFYVSASMECRSFVWHGDAADGHHYGTGNCFRTEAEAQAMADKFKELLKGGKK